MPQLTFHSNVPLVRQGLERLRSATPTIGKKRLYDAALDLARRMRKPGKKITYPVNWATEKQKIAFFASKGTFQKNYKGPSHIPTVRTKRYISNWKVVPISAGYRVENNSPGAKFIGGLADGTKQSPIHQGRWPLFRRQAEIVIRQLPKLVVLNLREIVRSIGKQVKKL